MSSVFNAISNALGTDGSGGGLLGMAAQLDKSVHNTIPGGWATLGVAALAIAAPYLAPALAGSAAAGDAAAISTAGDVFGGLAGTAGTGTGIADAGISSLLSSAGTGALTGGAMGGVKAAVTGQDPLTSILTGALTGGLTGAALSSLTSPALASQLGLSAPISTPVASALLAATKAIASGADPKLVLENTAISGALSSLGGQANSAMSGTIPSPIANAIIGAGTGAASAAIKGGNIGTGAETGAIGATVGSGLNALTAPSASVTPSSTPTDTSGTSLLPAQLKAEADALAGTASNQISNVQEAQSTLDAATSATTDAYNQAKTDQTALDKALTSTGYTDSYNALKDQQQNVSGLYSTAVDAQTAYTNAQNAFNTNPTQENYDAYKAASDAYTTAVNSYTTANTSFQTASANVQNLYDTAIAPLQTAAQNSTGALTQNLQKYGADQSTLSNVANSLGTTLSGLSQISNGQLASGVNIPDVAVSAPAAQIGPNTSPIDATATVNLGTTYAPLAGNVSSDIPTPLVPSNTTGVTATQAAFTSPYLLNANGNLMYDANGQPIPNPLAKSTTTEGVSNTGTVPNETVLPTPIDAFPDPSSPTGYTNNAGDVVNSNGTPYTGPVNNTANDVVANIIAGQTGSGGGSGGISTVTGPSTPGAPAGPDVPYVPGTPVDKGFINPSGGTATTTTPATNTGGASTTTTPATNIGGSSNAGAGTAAGVVAGIIAGGGGTGTGSGTGTSAGTGTGTGTGTGMGSGTGTGTSTTGTGTVAAKKTITPEKATFSKGTQITDPLSSIAAAPEAAPTAQAMSPLVLQEIQQAKNGGIIHRLEGGPVFLKGRESAHANLFGMKGSALASAPHMQAGGQPNNMSYQDRTLPEGHNPQFFSEGGLNSLHNKFVRGAGDGTSDSVPAMLANGEFVIPADVVSSLGNGSNESGAHVLDAFLKTVREHKQKHDAKHLPPDSKGPLAYLLKAQKKARA